MKIKKYKYVARGRYINKRDEIYYVGETADIKAIYKSIIRHSDECGIESYFEEFPKFNLDKDVYALCIEYTDYNYNYITVVNSDTMLAIICDGEVEEV